MMMKRAITTILEMKPAGNAGRAKNGKMNETNEANYRDLYRDSLRTLIIINKIKVSIRELTPDEKHCMANHGVGIHATGAFVGGQLIYMSYTGVFSKKGIKESMTCRCCNNPLTEKQIIKKGVTEHGVVRLSREVMDKKNMENK